MVIELLNHSYTVMNRPDITASNTVVCVGVVSRCISMQLCAEHV